MTFQESERYRILNVTSSYCCSDWFSEDMCCGKDACDIERSIADFLLKHEWKCILGISRQRRRI